MFFTASTSFNGNDTFSFKVNTNYTTSKRTGYIYAKKNGTNVATLTVKQDGIVLTVTPVSYTGSVLNGNGQEITYKVSSNMKVAQNDKENYKESEIQTKA